MNERIKEMWTVVCKEEMPELDETCTTLQRQKKFAELIVQECRSIAFHNMALDVAAEIEQRVGG